MRMLWMWVVAACAVSCTADRGGSLRGALEALQRRQRGRVHAPLPQSDYDMLYDFVPPQTYIGTLCIYYMEYLKYFHKKLNM